MSEEELLRLGAAGRVNAQVDVRAAPFAEGRRNVVVHVGLKLARLETLFPDQALQMFQAGGLYIAVHQPHDFTSQQLALAGLINVSGERPGVEVRMAKIASDRIA